MKTLRRVAILLCGAALALSCWKIGTILLEYRAGSRAYEDLADTAVLPAEQPELPVENIPETAPITVDFDALTAEYPDLVAWLYGPDTDINYPVVQAADNKYYLRRLPDGTGNSAGTIFMDYRNAADLSDGNTLLYGHNMRNGSMFGSLKKYRAQDYYEAHPVFYLLTPEGDYRAEIFAAFAISASGALFDLSDPAASRAAVLRSATYSNNIQSDVKVEEGARIVTLSTCTYDDSARYVVLAVLRPLDPAAGTEEAAG